LSSRRSSLSPLFPCATLFRSLLGGLLLALLFNRMTKAFSAMRAIVFMPRYIAVATSAVVFIWILHGNYGILNYILSLFGIKGPKDRKSTRLNSSHVNISYAVV